MENKSLSTYDSYTGPNAMEHFFEAINRYRILMEELFNEEGKKKLLEKREDIKKHYAAKTCHICDGEIKCPNKKEYDLYRKRIKEEKMKKEKQPYAGELSPEEEWEAMQFDEDYDKGHKVFDHCHWTGMFFFTISTTNLFFILGKYRGPAHTECNLKLKNTKKIPVFFHNLSGYDGHLIMQDIAKAPFKVKSIIAKTLEKYINFTCGEENNKEAWALDFKDSFQFLGTSLERLTKNLKAKADNDKGDFQKYFKHTLDYFNEKFPHLPHHYFTTLLLRKGVFPYTYIKSLDTLNERSLPEQKEFRNDLSETDCSDADYNHAREVWRVFDCQTLKDYHDLYMELDTHLLADIFERFRSESMEHYKIDPAHFCTAPALSWHACLKHTGVKLDIIGDVDMNLFIDSALMGGVSAARNPHLKANNPQVQGYDKGKLQRWLLLVDCNNQVSVCI